MHDEISKRYVGFLLTGIGLASFGFGLILAYVVVYLHDARGIGLGVAGVCLAGAGVSGLVFSLAAGTFIDRFGALRAIEVGMLTEAAAGVAISAVHNAPEAFAALTLAGAADAIFWPAQAALIVAVVPERLRTRGFAWQFMVLNGGIGLGGLVSGSVIHLYQASSYVHVYLAEATILVLAPILIAVGFRGFRPSPLEQSPQDRGSDLRRLLRYREVFSDRRFRAFLTVNLGFAFFGYAQLNAGWAAYATGYGGATPRVVGLAFGANTGVIVAAQMFVVSRVDRFARSKALALAATGWVLSWIMAFVASFATFRGAPADIILVASLGVFGLAETVYSPVSSALTNDLAPPRLRGRYNAVASSAFAGAGLLASPIAGVLLATGDSFAWTMPLIFGCGALSLLALRLSRVLPKSINHPSNGFGPNRASQED